MDDSEYLNLRLGDDEGEWTPAKEPAWGWVLAGVLIAVLTGGTLLALYGVK